MKYEYCMIHVVWVTFDCILFTMFAEQYHTEAKLSHG